MAVVSAAGHLKAGLSLAGRSKAGRSKPGPAKTKPRESTQSGRELVTLYASIAALGVAALGSAAASSLIAGLAGASGITAWLQGPAAALACVWAAAALVWAVAAFRTGRPPRASLTVRAVMVAAGVHLAVLFVGMWRLPEELRTFDLNVAAMLTLELSVLAALGWAHNSSLRLPARSASGHGPSALAVVGTLFAAAIIVAAVTTVGMAASTAGSLAVPHSGHGGHTPSTSIPGNITQLKNSGHHH